MTRRNLPTVLGVTLALVFALVAMPASAQSKAELSSQMQGLAAEINSARANGNEAAALSLLGQYNQLSIQAGGHDPAGLANGTGFVQVPSTEGVPAPTNCTPTLTTASDAPGIAIPDGPGGTVDVMMVVSGAGSFLADVDLTTDITHTWNDDLDIILTSPAGTVVVLSTINGGSNDNVFSGTLWDDNSAELTTDTMYANLVTAGPLVPEGALAAFYGEDPNGTWTLTVNDNVAADTGTINSWQLDITTFDQVPTAAGPTAFADAPGTAIPDGPGGTVDVTIAVSGVGDYLSDVNLTTDITHTWNDDLDILLISPAGTTVVLSTINGGSNDNVFSGTLWDDNAAELTTDTMYANLVTAGPLVPEGALGAFIGENPNGTWTLRVNDNVAADTGTINSWQLDIDTATCGTPGAAPGEVLAIPTLDTLGLILLLAGLGLAGLFVIRRRFA